MGLKDWVSHRGLEKARANLRSTLKKLVPAADADWGKTERCLLAEFWPLPKVDPNVERYQKELLEVLMIWKGQLSDREAVRYIGAEIQTAGVGAKMAVRHVVITEWSKHGKPGITEAEMEQILGSREEDRQRSEWVRAYALRHLALEKAVAETRGKRPAADLSLIPGNPPVRGHDSDEVREHAMELARLNLHQVDPKIYITYANNERQCFCQVRLQSGERILVAGARGEIRVHRLALFGLMPRGALGIFSAAHLATILPFELTYGLFEKKAITHPLDSLSIFFAILPDIAAIRDFFRSAQDDQAAAVKHVLTTVASRIPR